MNVRYIALSMAALSLSLCSIATAQGLSKDRIQALVEDLEHPFLDGFQWEDLIAVSIALETHFADMPELTLREKRDTLQQVLNSIIHRRKLSPAKEHVLRYFTPGIAYVLFPSSIDETLITPTTPSSKEQEILQATEALLDNLKGKLGWKDIPSCILYAYNFSSNYPALSQTEKAHVAKKILGEVIDRTDTPILPDCIFDEVFKRVGYALIDHLSKR